MTDDIKFVNENEEYLLTQILDKVITVERAQEILTHIATECSILHCNKVMIDERTVERREVPSHEIMELSQGMKKMGLNKIYIAFWCQPHLINKDSSLLSSFTYNTEYLIKHFSDKTEALDWLDNQPTLAKTDHL